MCKYWHVQKQINDITRLLTRRRLSDRWEYSIETLKRWEKNGKLNPLKLGRNVRYRLADIEALERQAEVRK